MLLFDFAYCISHSKSTVIYFNCYLPLLNGFCNFGSPIVMMVLRTNGIKFQIDDVIKSIVEVMILEFYCHGRLLFFRSI